MNAEKNQFTLLSPVVSLGRKRTAGEYEKFANIYRNADWSNKVLAVSNYLALPVSACLLEPELRLLDGTNGAELGFSTLSEFVTSKDNGIDETWDNWKASVQSMLHKLEFGINSNSREDVALQIQDVTTHLGRRPVSKFEFNLAKDQIIKQQFEDIEAHHHSVQAEMSEKISKLLKTLDTKQKENETALSNLEDALLKVKELQESAGKYEQQSVDYSKYIELEIHNRLVSQIESLREEQVDLVEAYAQKAEKLSFANEELRTTVSKLKGVIKIRNSEIAKLSAHSGFGNAEKVSELNGKILELRKKLVKALEGSVHQQKKINSYARINTKHKAVQAMLKKRAADAIAKQAQPAIEPKTHQAKKIARLSSLTKGILLGIMTFVLAGGGILCIL